MMLPGDRQAPALMCTGAPEAVAGRSYIRRRQASNRPEQFSSNRVR